MKTFFYNLIIIILCSITTDINCYSCDRALKSIIDQRSMSQVRELQKVPQCAVHAKLATWIALKENFKSVQFDDYHNFISHNKTWPRQKTFIKKAEALADQASDQAILKWFKQHPPRTGAGALNYLDVCHINTQQPVAVQQLAQLRKLWINVTFSADEENHFLQYYQSFLRPNDHRDKIVQLLNKGDVITAKRLRSLSPVDHQAVIDARIAFITHQDNAEEKLAYMNRTYSHDPDLLLDHLNWLRTRKHPHAIEFLFKHRPQMLNNPVKLWKETYILIRRTLEDNNYKQAMQLVSNHGLKTGIDYFEAEWLRGWLTLKLLKNAHMAQKIFQHLNSVATTPVSVAKTAYWTAVTSQICEPNIALAWFKKAANYPTTFYGQISLKYLKQMPKLTSIMLPDVKVQQHFHTRELVQVLKILKTMGLKNYYRDFLYVLMEQLPASEKILAVQLAKKIDPDYVVNMARLIFVTRGTIVEDSYPLLTAKIQKNAADLDIALMHAVVRKESCFDYNAVSPAGAVGLMQVMPETGRILMKSLQIKYKHPVDLTDPALNIRLGSTYLVRQLEKFDGSVVMALSAYNAGAKPVLNWIEYFGDPRNPDVDWIDWIEMIPFGETRNYVQRVIENQGVYQIILNKRIIKKIKPLISGQVMKKNKQIVKRKI